ncbi:MAG: SURF1 family protein [Dermatophilaceae bacterium]
MVRAILSPRSLGLLALAVVLSALCVLAGLWQLRVARDDGRQAALESAEARAVLPLTSVVAPHAAFPADGSNQRVEAIGRYEADKQLLIPDRRLGGAEGYWVLTPLTVSATGARLPVVRGFVRSPAAARAPLTTGDVTLVGSLAPGESPREPATALGAGQLGSVDIARLVNMWDGEIYNAFVFAVSETPDASGAGPAGASAHGTIERIPPPELPSGYALRNLAYALQWWVFALFALWMWWKMVRDAHRRVLTTRSAHAGPPGVAAPPPRPEAGAPL